MMTVTHTIVIDHFVRDVTIPAEMDEQFKIDVKKAGGRILPPRPSFNGITPYKHKEKKNGSK